MLVKDLIDILHKLPPDLPVFFDITAKDAETFNFCSVDEVEEVETDYDDKIVLLVHQEIDETFSAN